MNKIRILLGALVLMVSVQTNAAVIEYDLSWIGIDGYSVGGGFSFNDSISDNSVSYTEMLTLTVTAFDPAGDAISDGFKYPNTDTFFDSHSGWFNFDQDIEVVENFHFELFSLVKSATLAFLDPGHGCGDGNFIYLGHGGCSGDDPLDQSPVSNSLVATRISPIPAPPALLLFGTGLLGLIGVSRGRKAA